MAKKKTSLASESPELDPTLIPEDLIPENPVIVPEKPDSDDKAAEIVAAEEKDALQAKCDGEPEADAHPDDAPSDSEEVLSLDIIPLEPEASQDDSLSRPPTEAEPDAATSIASKEEVPSEPKPDLPAKTPKRKTAKAAKSPEPKTPEQPPLQEEQKDSSVNREPSERQSFFGLDFHELDRDLSDEERQEWNSIYASYRGRSVMSGTIIGVDRHAVNVRNRQTGGAEQQSMYCAIVIPFRVRIVIPEAEMWDSGQERPGYVLQNMVGASIDFVIMKVDREGGFAIASRRQAGRARRYFFSRRPALYTPGSRLKCRILSVGPRRCLVECHGHDIGLTQRDMRYTAIPDLRTEYHPGEELDCIVKQYAPENDKLIISVKETMSNPFEGAELRHPVGSRRQAVIAGKYGGGVFCNLPDGTVCMCAYAFQHEDSDFQIGDTAIVAIQRYDMAKKQIYGKIITKW